MRKDIEIPEVKGLSLVALFEDHEELGKKVWNIYLLNSRKAAIDTIMVVLRGYTEDKKTSVMRRTLDKLAPDSLAHLEFLPENLLEFRNEYLVTFFEGNTMFEKNFILDPGALSVHKITDIPKLGTGGIIFD